VNEVHFLSCSWRGYEKVVVKLIVFEAKGLSPMGWSFLQEASELVKKCLKYALLLWRSFCSFPRKNFNIQEKNACCNSLKSWLIYLFFITLHWHWQLHWCFISCTYYESKNKLIPMFKFSVYLSSAPNFVFVNLTTNILHNSCSILSGSKSKNVSTFNHILFNKFFWSDLKCAPKIRAKIHQIWNSGLRFNYVCYHSFFSIIEKVTV
jgi:hypothetical protein